MVSFSFSLRNYFVIILQYLGKYSDTILALIFEEILCSSKKLSSAILLCFIILHLIHRPYDI